jgi:hypothetical protein
MNEILFFRFGWKFPRKFWVRKKPDGLFGDSLLIFFFEKQKKTHDTRKFVMYANIVTITIN